MIKMLQQAFRAVAEIFGWSRDRSKLRNQESVVKAKEANEENAKVDAANKAVKEENLDEIRKQLSE